MRKVADVDSKALIPVGGRLIVDRMLEAIAQSQRVGPVRVVCAAGSRLLAHAPQVAVAARGPKFVDSIESGFDALGHPERALLLTGDLPLLDGECLDHFCGQALQSGANIVYSIIRKQVSEQAFPGGRRLYVRLRDGAFTGGNLALLSREVIQTHRQRIEQAYAARKNPIRLCGMMGPLFVVRLLLGRLTVAQLVERGCCILGTSVAVVDSPYPAIGFDVDKPSNLAAVESWLAAHPQGKREPGAVIPPGAAGGI